MKQKKKISTVYLADVLLRANRPLTAKEVMEGIRHYHPNVVIDNNFVYARLNVFCKSKNIICKMHTDERPFKFEMKYVTQSHFKSRGGVKVDFSDTVIPAGGAKFNEKKAAECAALLRKIWDDCVRRRKAIS